MHRSPHYTPGIVSREHARARAPHIIRRNESSPERQLTCQRVAVYSGSEPIISRNCGYTKFSKSLRGKSHFKAVVSLDGAGFLIVALKRQEANAGKAAPPPRVYGGFMYRYPFCTCAYTSCSCYYSCTFLRPGRPSPSRGRIKSRREVIHARAVVF